MSSSMFGWDLMYKLAENDINKKDDVLLVLVHWFLIKNGLKCVGLGDDKTLPKGDEGTEALPKEWNKGPVYALRYVYKEKLYILHGTKSEDDIIFNLMRASDMVVSNVTFNVEKTVKQVKGPLDKTIPTYSAEIDKIKKNLVEPVFLGKNRAVSTQTAEDPVTGPDVLPPRRFGEDTRSRQPDPEMGRWNPFNNALSYEWPNMDQFSVGSMTFNSFGLSPGISNSSNYRNPTQEQLPPQWPDPDWFNGSGGMLPFPHGLLPHLNLPSSLYWDPFRDPLAVGRSDLDPFSRGGGMIFDPFNFPGGLGPDTSGIPGGLPRGSVPPGARFDPVGPPIGGIGRTPSRGRGRGQPDHDHLPPPGYDDMFM